MIAGHKKQRDILKKIARNKNISHALLFSGPEKIGKRLVAIEFIKNLFCESGNSCGKCYSCRTIDSGNFPDLAMINPNEGNLEISQIRDLQNRLSLKSYNNSLKVGIINDAHLMKRDTQNALLKTLEEPKGDALLILITSYPDMLLPTIRSRVEEIKFGLVGREEIENILIEMGSEKEKAREIALISSGQIGKALEFLNNPEKLKLFNDTIKDITFLCQSELYERFNYAKNFKENPEEIINVVDIWERFFRREMLLNIFNNKGTIKNYSLKKIKDVIDELEKTKYLISNTNTNKKLALENLLIQL